MKTTEQFVWLRKAGAMAACSVLVGANPAQAASGHLPIAGSVPVGNQSSLTRGAAGASGSSWTPGNHGNGQSFSFGATAATSANAASTVNLSNGNYGHSNNGNGHSNGHGNFSHQWNPNSNYSHGNRNSVGNTSYFGQNNFGGNINLDLSSTATNIALGANLFSTKGSVTINLGGTSQTFKSGDKVTAAEYLAIREVLSGNSQTLVLSNKGAATGGNFTISAVSSSKITELVVPKGVTAIDYSINGQAQIISGDLINYGTIYGVVGSGMGNSISIKADEIINHGNALISTQAPSALLSSIGGVLAPVNLTLTAVNDLTNSGSIISSGSLSLASTSGSITNGPSSAAVPTIRAARDITLTSGSGNFTNGGLVTSTGGNINFAAPSNKNINIVATGGTFQALKGNINVRNASYAGNADVNMTDGDYLSRNLNINSGTGTIEGNINQVTGMLNTNAGAVHMIASTATLSLGNNKVGGDPTFVNDSGDITISGNNNFSEDVAIVASGSIIAASDGQIVDNGHNVTLVAGAYITESTTTGDGNGGINGKVATSVTIDTAKSSAAGGNVDLMGSTVKTVIDTSSATGDAGNVTMVAFASQPIPGGTTSEGAVLMANSSVINATAGGSGHGGNVLLIASSNNEDSTNQIRTGSILTGGGAAGGQGGNIGLYTTNITTTDAPGNTLITFGANGNITTGNNFAAGSTISPNSSLGVYGDLVTAPVGQSGLPAGTNGASAGDITIVAGNSINTQNLLAFGGGGAGGDSQSLNGGNGGNGGNITVSSSGSFATVNVNGQVNSAGGGGGGGGSNGSAGGSGGAGGNGGSISLSETGAGSPGQMQLATVGGVYASQGGAGGSGSATAVGGGGGTWGGGGGGGSSGTGGTVGNAGTQGFGGGAGGAGFFGGGGGDLDGAGGGGGYTAGGAGGSALNASAGGVSAGGNGIYSLGATPMGGLLSSSQQGGQGAGSGADGANIPTTIGGGNVALFSAGFAQFGGQITGSNVNINMAGPLNLTSNVVGTNSVTIRDTAGAILETVPGTTILTPNLIFNMGTIINPALTIGNGTVPLSTNAQNITITGNVFGAWFSDSASNVRLDASGVGASNTLSVIMTGNNSTISVAGLPSFVANVVLNTGSSSLTGGTVNFEQPTVSIPSGGKITVTTNNLSWNNSATTGLAISANNTAGTGGTIAITTNLVNGSNSFAVGKGAGQLSLSATAAKGAVGITGGTINLTATGANVTVDGSALDVGYSDASTAGNGGNITLKVGTLTGAVPGPTIINASAAGAATGTGTGNGGTISITTNSSAGTSIGTASNSLMLVATNGGATSTATQTGGNVTFINNGSGALTVDTAGLAVTSTAGGAVNVNGGSMTLTASTVSAAAGTLTVNADGIGTGNGGKISITQTNTVSPATVTLGPTGQFDLSARGGVSGGNGGSVTFSTQGDLLLTTDANGNVVGSGLSAAVQPQAVNGAGGVLTLTANTFANADPVVGAAKALIFDVSGQGTGNGGRIRLNQLNADTNMTIGKAAGNFQFIANNGASGLSGGTVIVTIGNNATSTGTAVLTVDPAAMKILTTNANNKNVNGGFLEVLAPTVVASANVPATGPLILNAKGAGTGRGGTVIFEESNANSSPVLGTGAGQFQLLASGGTGGGSGGAIIATSGGNLTVNPAGVNVRASVNGNGGSLNLSALNFGGIMDGSEGNLLVTGNLSVAPAGTGLGGTIGLLSTSSVAFDAGTATVNGVIGTVAVTRGNLNISTGGTGGIVVNKATTSPEFVTFTLGAGGSGDLTINAAVGGKNTSQIFVGVTGSNTTLFGNLIGGATGSLVTNASGSMVLNVQDTISGQTTTGQLKINTTNLTANTVTGDINVNDTISLTSTLTLQQINAGNSFNISSGGSITTAGFDGNGGGTTAIAANQGSITANAALNGQYSAPTLDASSPRYNQVNKFIFECIQATYKFGNVVNLSVTNPGNNSNNNSNLKTLALTGNNGVFVFGTDSLGGFSLQSDNNMDLTGKFGNSKTNESIFGGNGVSVTGDAVISGTSVSFTTLNGSLGAAGSALQTKTPSLSLDNNGTGDVYINNQSTALFAVSALSPAGNLTISTAGTANYSNLTSLSGNVNLSSHGATTINNISSAFDLNITNTAGLLTFSNSSANNNIVVSSTGGANVTGLSAPTGTVNISVANVSNISNSQSSGTFTVNATKGALTVSGVSSQTAAVNITGAAAVNVNNLTNDGDIAITGGATSVDTVTSNNGQVTLTVNGASTLSNVNAETGITVAGKNTISATNLATNNGSINFSDNGAATLDGLFANNGNIVITDNNTTTVTGAGLSAVTAGVGSITLTSKGEANLAGLGASVGITITTSHGLNADSVTSDTGGITVTANGAGAVALSNFSTLTSGDIIITSKGATTSVAGFNSTGAITIAASNSTTVGSMTASGATGAGFISVIAHTGTLQTANDAQIYSQNDSILLQNSNKTLGAIIINTGSDIETGAKPNPGGNGGFIAITIGAPPTPAASPSQQGLAPTANVTATTIDGVIYWGKNGITANADSLGNGNTVTAKGANVIFNTGKLAATAITLEGNTTIIADPPVMAMAATAGSEDTAVAAQAARAHAPAIAPAALQINQPVADSTAIRISPVSLQRQNGLTSGNSNFININSLLYGTKPAPAVTSECAWVTETELATGAIPAVVSSDDELGLHSDVSSIVDMTGDAAGDTAGTATVKPATLHLGANGTLQGGVEVAAKSSVKKVRLNRGTVVFAPTRATQVETPFGSVTLAAKSLTLVMVLQNGIAVYDLDDTHHGSVKLTAGGREFALTPGRHAMLTRAEGSRYENVNPAQLFAYRAIKHEAVGSSEAGAKMHVFTGEFNLMQAIATVMPLKQLVVSENSDAKKIGARLLKTTGIMSEITASGEQFKQLPRPNIISMRD